MRTRIGLTLLYAMALGGVTMICPASFRWPSGRWRL
jgi:hypothetical protein